MTTTAVCTLGSASTRQRRTGIEQINWRRGRGTVGECNEPVLWRNSIERTGRDLNGLRAGGGAIGAEIES